MVVKGNVDSELVLHAMIQYNKYDKALIVSGDGDFHCLIEYLDEKEKLLKVLVPTSRYSSLIRKFNEKGYIARIDLIKRSVAKKRTGIRVRSKP